MFAAASLLWSRYSGTILIVAGALVAIAGIYGVGCAPPHLGIQPMIVDELVAILG